MNAQLRTRLTVDGISTLAIESFDPPCLLITITSTGSWLQVMDAIMADPRLGRNLTAPSISAGRDNLYMRGKYMSAEARPSFAGPLQRTQ